jgi:hypothetical protein
MPIGITNTMAQIMLPKNMGRNSLTELQLKGKRSFFHNIENKETISKSITLARSCATLVNQNPTPRVCISFHEGSLGRKELNKFS